MHPLITFWTWTLFLFPTNINTPNIQLRSLAFPTEQACQANLDDAHRIVCPGPNETNCANTVGLASCEKSELLLSR